MRTVHIAHCRYSSIHIFILYRENRSIVSVSFCLRLFSFVSFFFSNVPFHFGIHSPIRPDPIISYTINLNTFADINKFYYLKKTHTHISSTIYVIFIDPYIRVDSVDSVCIVWCETLSFKIFIKNTFTICNVCITSRTKKIPV